MLTGQSSIAELTDAYKDARAAILQTPEPEQSIGLASLRIEAEHTYRELSTTARSLQKQDLAPLEEYVANLTGGERAEQVVAFLDAKAEEAAKSVLSSLNSYLATGVLAGAGATALGIVAAFTGAAVSAGEAAGAAGVGVLLAGGGAAWIIVRGVAAALKAGSEAASDAWLKTWAWAQSLGKRSDEAMSRARLLQASIWGTSTGAPWRFKPLTDRARTRAQLLVGLTWALLALGGLLVAYGVINGAAAALQEKSQPQIEIPGITPPPPP
jgi:hypothetical protein